MKRTALRRYTPLGDRDSLGRRLRPRVAGKVVPCPVCGESFVSYGTQKTCSMKCKLAKGLKKRRRICKTCGQEFVTDRPARTNKFCSAKCMGIASRKPPYEFDCPGCGKHVVLRAIGGRKQRYCTRECRNKHYRGAECTTWRGNRRHERGPTWASQRDAARARDQKCMAIGCKATSLLWEKLSVDHIVPYRLTVVYGKDEAIDPNHIDNLICLCRGHHAKKTAIESRLLRGDLIGFETEIYKLMPWDRVAAALKLWGLLRSEHGNPLSKGCK